MCSSFSTKLHWAPNTVLEPMASCLNRRDTFPFIFRRRIFYGRVAEVGRSRGLGLRRRGDFRVSFKHGKDDGKDRAFAFARAVGVDGAGMQFDEFARDGQAQAQTAHRMRALQIPSKDVFGFIVGHADAGIGYFDGEFVPGKRISLNGNLPAVGGELGGVFQHVPENLLEADGVAPDFVVLGLEMDFEEDLLFDDFAFDDGDGVLEDGVDVDFLAVEGDLAAGDAGEVEEIVDEPGFQLDVFADGMEIHADLRGQLVIVGAVAGEHEHGVEGGAEFVGERGQKFVLGAVGRLFPREAFREFALDAFAHKLSMS